MSVDHSKHRELIERLLGPTGYQLDCEECFELVNEYAELELIGIEADSLIPGLHAHLEGCAACHEDHESLRALLDQLGKGKRRVRAKGT
jgi:hypothetical protein